MITLYTVSYAYTLPLQPANTTADDYQMTDGPTPDPEHDTPSQRPTTDHDNERDHVHTQTEENPKERAD